MAIHSPFSNDPASLNVPLSIPVRGQNSITVPGGDMLLRAEFSRQGEHLLIKPDIDVLSRPVLLEDYFSEAQPPDLLTQSGANLTADLVARLAGSVAPALYAGPASGSSAVGTVDSLSGKVEITRASGEKIIAIKGMAIKEGDVIKSADDGKVGLVFADDSTFALGKNGRMVVEELSFDPGAKTGSMTHNVVQGVFSFHSGKIASFGADAMKVKTPVAVIGVRGTSVAGTAAAEGSENKIALLESPDGHVGAVTVSNASGQVVHINQANQQITVTSSFQAPSQPVTVSTAQINNTYSDVISSLPVTNFQTSGAVAQRNDAGGAEEDAAEEGAAEEDAAEEGAAEEDAAEEGAAEEDAAEEGAAEEDAAEEDAAEEGAAEEGAAEEGAAEEGAAEEGAAEEGAAEEGAAEEGAAEEGAAEEGAAEEGGAEQGAAEEGAAEEGAAEEGGAEQGAAEEGAAEEGAAEEGAAEEGAAEEGGAEQGVAEEGGAEQGVAEEGGAEQGGAAEEGGAEQGGVAEEGGAEQGSAEEGVAEEGGAEQGAAEEGGAAEQENVGALQGGSSGDEGGTTEEAAPEGSVAEGVTESRSGESGESEAQQVEQAEEKNVGTGSTDGGATSSEATDVQGEASQERGANTASADSGDTGSATESAGEENTSTSPESGGAGESETQTASTTAQSQESQQTQAQETQQSQPQEPQQAQETQQQTQAQEAQQTQQTQTQETQQAQTQQTQETQQAQTQQTQETQQAQTQQTQTQETQQAQTQQTQETQQAQTQQTQTQETQQTQTQETQQAQTQQASIQQTWTQTQQTLVQQASTQTQQTLEQQTPIVQTVASSSSSLGDSDGNATETSVNIVPTVSAFSTSGYEDTTIVFTKQKFVDAFKSGDGGTLQKVQFTSLPAGGTLLIGKNKVAEGQEVSAGQLNRLRFEPEQNFNGEVSFSWRGSDGQSYSNSPATVKLSLAAVNDVAVLGSGGNTLNITENDTTAAINSSLTLSDVDDTDISSAAVSIGTGFVSGEDELTFTDTGNITGSYDSGTGVLTLSGIDTVANYEAALRTVGYINNSENPDTSNRTVSFVVNDGTGESIAIDSTVAVA
ncbi:hypothetical protein ACQZV8_07940, partial [Magnetococcales bacterium HHB-1]